MALILLFIGGEKCLRGRDVVKGSREHGAGSHQRVA